MVNDIDIGTHRGATGVWIQISMGQIFIKNSGRRRIKPVSRALGSFIHIGAGFDISFKIEIRILMMAYIRSKRKFPGGDRAIIRSKAGCHRSPDAC